MNAHLVLPKLRRNGGTKLGGAYVCTNGARGASEQSTKTDTALSAILSNMEAVCAHVVSAKKRANLQRARDSRPAYQMS